MLELRQDFNQDGFAEFRGIKDGPTVVILGGIHGDEDSGINNLKLVHQTLQRTGINSGRVFLGWGNPRAMFRNERYIESDLNRLFLPDEFLSDDQRKSLEYERAQVIKHYLDEADVLHDNHATNNHLGTPFVLGESNSYHLTKYYSGVGIRLSGVDEHQPGGTDWYMNQILGRPGICLEPGYKKNPLSTAISVHCSFALLAATGNIRGELVEASQKTFMTREVYRIQSDAYALCRPFRDFESIEPGQALAIDGTEIVEAKKPGVIIFASRMILANRQGTQTFYQAEEIKS